MKIYENCGTATFGGHRLDPSRNSTNTGLTALLMCCAFYIHLKTPRNILLASAGS